MDAKVHASTSVAKRVGGGIIDLVCLFVFSLVWGLVTDTAAQVASNQEVAVSLDGRPFFFAALVCFFIFALLEYYFGKTPGKLIAGTRVVSLAGERLCFWQALVRNLLRFVDGIGIYLLGLIILLVMPQRQRLGDLLARTHVIDDVVPSVVQANHPQQ